MNVCNDIEVNTEGAFILFTWGQLVIAWNPCKPRWYRVRCAVVHSNGDINVSGVGKYIRPKKCGPSPKARRRRNRLAREKWRKNQLAKKSCNSQGPLVHP